MVILGVGSSDLARQKFDRVEKTVCISFEGAIRTMSVLTSHPSLLTLTSSDTSLGIKVTSLLVALMLVT